MRKRKKRHTSEDLAKSILEHKNEVYLPNGNEKLEKIETYSWFKIKETKNAKNLSITTDEYTQSVYARKYKYYPTSEQEKILYYWAEASTTVYNEALRILKNTKKYDYRHKNSEVKMDEVVNVVEEVVDVIEEVVDIEEVKEEIPEKKKINLIKKVKEPIIKNIDKRRTGKSVKKNNKKTNPNKKPKKNWKPIVDYYVIRKELKALKKKLIKKMKAKKIPTTPVHVLDGAIKRAVANYKSALTNYFNGNIKHFRVRYYKYKRDFYNLYIEPIYIKKNGDISGLGKLELYDIETKEEYQLEKEKIKKEFILQYNKEEGGYFICIVNSRKNNDTKEKSEFISIDPGIKPFLTGVSDRNITVIDDSKGEIKKLLEKIDKRNKIKKGKNLGKKGVEKKKRKYEKRINKKIKNKVNDMHWKTIQYLTSNYKEILIGDMSVKGITSKKSNLNAMSKRVILKFSVFQFKQRLARRCEELNILYREINEYRTSKTCSICGKMNEIGMSKNYKCIHCETEWQRDVNGARCIYCVSKIPIEEEIVE